MDKRASMGALGDVDRYKQFQAADALRDAAQTKAAVRAWAPGLEPASRSVIRWLTLLAPGHRAQARAHKRVRLRQPRPVPDAVSKTRWVQNSAQTVAAKWRSPRYRASSAAPRYAKVQSSALNADPRRKKQSARTARLSFPPEQSSVRMRNKDRGRKLIVGIRVQDRRS
jgi:hypothetical protein